MNYGDFSFIADFLLRHAKQTVTPDKAFLIENRLMPLVRACGLPNISTLFEHLRHNPGPKLIQAVVDAMSAGESMFFRDGHPFEALRRVIIPRLMEQRASNRVLRLWSAACAGGQEPYSLAMLLQEHFALDGWYVNLVATDLSQTMLDRARDGTYSDFEVQRGLPPGYLGKYFERKGERWRIKSALRDMIEFRRIDLTGDISGLGAFDVVLCRNVLVYFDQWSQARALKAIASQLAADGVLLLGEAEAVFGLEGNYVEVPPLRGVMCRRGCATWLPEGIQGDRVVSVPPLGTIEFGWGKQGMKLSDVDKAGKGR